MAHAPKEAFKQKDSLILIGMDQQEWRSIPVKHTRILISMDINAGLLLLRSGQIQKTTRSRASI